MGFKPLQSSDYKPDSPTIRQWTVPFFFSCRKKKHSSTLWYIQIKYCHAQVLDGNSWLFYFQVMPLCEHKTTHTETVSQSLIVMRAFRLQPRWPRITATATGACSNWIHAQTVSPFPTSTSHLFLFHKTRREDDTSEGERLSVSLSLFLFPSPLSYAQRNQVKSKKEIFLL